MTFEFCQFLSVCNWYGTVAISVPYVSLGRSALGFEQDWCKRQSVIKTLTWCSYCKTLLEHSVLPSWCVLVMVCYCHVSVCVCVCVCVCMHTGIRQNNTTKNILFLFPHKALIHHYFSLAVLFAFHCHMSVKPKESWNGYCCGCRASAVSGPPALHRQTPTADVQSVETGWRGQRTHLWHWHCLLSSASVSLWLNGCPIGS